MKSIFYKKRRLKAGQSAVELAVFGAVLIFLVGSIIRYTLSTSYQQDMSLKAMRMAMRQSYRHSSGVVQNPGGTDGDASRNSASVVLIEDRLTPDSGRHMAKDRFPIVLSGSGTHSRNLFIPVEYTDENHKEWWSLPMFDMYVNGVHFVFSTAGFKRQLLGKLVNDQDVAVNPNLTVGDVHPDWDPECAHLIGNQSRKTGCRRLFRRIVNQRGGGKKKFCWQDGTGPKGGGYCGNFNNLSAEERFDLDRSGKVQTAGFGTGAFRAAHVDVLSTEREEFGWQWFLVYAFKRDKNNTFTITKGQNISTTTQVNNVVDVDGDLKEETILDPIIANHRGVMTVARVLDYQEGDIDFTAQEYDNKPAPGLTNNIQMYSFVKDGEGEEGTYLLMEEGRLFESAGDDKQYIRSTQKKDQVDLIMREIQLHNNTGAFCKSDNVTPQTNAHNYPNPVEVCSPTRSGCFTTDNVDKICMFTGDLAANPPEYPMIFVRTRVQSKQGRKWITDTSQDDYIDFRGAP